jgi:hypothetical protein
MIQHQQNLCPHKQNPTHCITCYHARANARPTSQPKPAATIPQTVPLMDSVKKEYVQEFYKAHGRVPTPQELAGEPEIVRMGVEADGTPIPLPEPKPFVGPMPKPVLTAAQSAAAQSEGVREPFSYARQPAKPKEMVINGVKQTVMVPPKRPSLIDSLPRHPDADKYK